MPNNTIFDDVFRTMPEKMPYLAVPLINEVFHTSYPQDVKITQLRNEYMEKDGKTHLYRVPTIKLENYTSDSIFEKNLLMLLPFYIMRYEKSAHAMSENPEMFQELLNEYEDIRHKLEMKLTAEERSQEYRNLIELMIQISDYIFRNEEKIRKGVGDIMGGQVLELASERIERLTRESMEKEMKEIKEKAAQAEAQGEERMGILINKLILDGRSDEIQKVIADPELRKRMYEEYGIK